MIINWEMIITFRKKDYIGRPTEFNVMIPESIKWMDLTLKTMIVHGKHTTFVKLKKLTVNSYVLNTAFRRIDFILISFNFMPKFSVQFSDDLIHDSYYGVEITECSWVDVPEIYPKTTTTPQKHQPLLVVFTDVILNNVTKNSLKQTLTLGSLL